MKKSKSRPSVLALRAAHLIERLGRLIRAEDHAGGLAPAQWEALRYLARANRFSRTPAALADYLGATRGTVSQTLIALEGKGYVKKSESPRDRRSVDLGLTAAGRSLLADDALRALARDIDATGGAAGVADDLEGALRTALRRRGGRPFGVCRACRYFRKSENDITKLVRHCVLLDEPLSPVDAEAICFEQAPR